MSGRSVDDVINELGMMGYYGALITISGPDGMPVEPGDEQQRVRFLFFGRDRRNAETIKAVVHDALRFADRELGR